MTRGSIVGNRLLVAALAACALLLSALGFPAATAAAPAAPGTAAQSTPPTPTAWPLGTWQTNGTVWSMAIVNGVTYVGGTFTAVRPPGSAPGQNETPRRHLAAFNTTTGALLPWAPRLTSPPVTFTGTPDINCNPVNGSQYECATVWSVRASPDNKTLYVGGDFQAVNGQARPHLAAFDLPSGALNPTFKPAVTGGTVRAIAPTNTTAYVGGTFTRVAGTARSRLAAVTKANQLLPWAPAADKAVMAMVLTPDLSRVIVGGKFDTLNGTARHGVGSIYTSGAGARAPWAGNQVPAITFTTSLTMANNVVYLTGDSSKSAGEGLRGVDPYTGVTKWNDACHGASHSMVLLRGVAIVGSHSHDCSGMVDGFGEQFKGYGADRKRYKLRAEVPAGDGTGRFRLLYWFPHTNDGNGPRAMATDGNTLWVGGEFTLIDDRIQQQGLTRFTFADRGGPGFPPVRPAAVKASAETAGKVTVGWQATEDRDDKTLTYQLVRDGDMAHPIAQVTKDGTPWSEPWMSFTDTAVVPGRSYRYAVRAIDPGGHTSPLSFATTVTVPSATVVPQNLAATDGAVLNYRFEERSGSTVTSKTGTRTAALGAQAHLGVFGALGYGLRLDGSPAGAAVDSVQEYAQRQVSVEAMFRTTTTTGGVLLSMGTGATPAPSSTSDRSVLYMSDDGHLNWGFTPDRPNFPFDAIPSQQAVRTAAAYNDGAWHHVVGTFEPGTGARIYVDGALAADNPALNWSRSLLGRFRIGGDTTRGWPNKPTSDYWHGTIDEVAAYDYPLTAEQIADHANGMLRR